VVAVLIAMNAVLVAAQFALVTVRRTRIEQLVAQGNPLARVVKRAMEDPNRFIAAGQVGITIASLGIGWVGEPAVAGVLDPLLDRFLPSRLAFITAHGIGVAVAFAVITLLHLVLGEQVPKMFALQRAEGTILITAQITRVFSMIFRPVIASVYWSSEVAVRILGLEHQGERHLVYSVEELELLVIASAEGGHLEQSEQEIIHRVFNFADITTTNVAVADITNGITVDAGAGDDRVSIGRGVTASATINGGDGNDDLSGGNGDDTIDGGAGNDHIRGGAGADVLKGGAGDDTINARDGEVHTVDGGSDTNGDIAIVDSTTQTAGNTTPDTVDDTVTNVEANRAGGGGFGGFGGFFGGGFGRHGFGGHHHGFFGGGDGDGGTTTGSGGTTTTTTPTILPFRFARGGAR